MPEPMLSNPKHPWFEVLKAKRLSRRVPGFRDRIKFNADSPVFMARSRSTLTADRNWPDPSGA
jgi:hypothetical protein